MNNPGAPGALEAKNIHKAYFHSGSDLQILKGINLFLPAGSFTALVGPSGAGKSTLLHILGGLDRPTEGQVLVGGRNIYGMDDAALCALRANRIGFIFQFYHLLPEFTVLENVMLAAHIAGGRSSFETEKEAKELLRSVGMEKRASHFPSQLSGGEQQRAAVARALINRPEFLLCDEPTGNLDSVSGAEVTDLLKRINREKGTTLVLVTHNQELARVAEAVYSLRDGLLHATKAVHAPQAVAHR
jgi:ABC-type lipoprotein export system ATPase subunit